MQIYPSKTNLGEISSSCRKFATDFMKLYLIAGEASGDLHGANLVRALFRRQPDLECRAWGGDRMAQAGATVVKHYRDLAFMGFWEVLKNLRVILRNLAFCKKDIAEFRPDEAAVERFCDSLRSCRHYQCVR